ncbi:MAG: hypothetical protein ABT01_03665 [Clostridium sp. SCN 57-10]|mgnify:CR=1 FL=1|nr:MAG: hypothetical protein ABT01_03665 [Clostridium sp. SCN 57-10]
MNNVILVRHGETAGNAAQRYIGTTNEPLSQEGAAALRTRVYPRADRLFVSPLLRCVQTAAILYPAQPYEVVPDLRECDFGHFEGKNYIELADDERYAAWLASDGHMPFPNGESREGFALRATDAFAASLAKCGEGESAAFVVHGGTIMAILERFARPARAFYDWHVPNGNGFVVRVLHGGTLEVEGTLW